MSLTGIGTLFAALLGVVQNRFSPKLLLISGLLANTIGVFIISTAQGMKQVALMPEVWLIGFTAAGIYAAYVGLQYFLPFLNSVFVVPVVAGAIFGLINTSLTGMFASPVSGLLADNVFKSPIRYLSILMAVLCLGLLLLINFPRGESMLVFTIILLLVVAFMIYLGRGVYYAPIGCSGLIPQDTLIRDNNC